MKKKMELPHKKEFDKLVRKVASFKVKKGERRLKDLKSPTKKELARKWRYDKKTGLIVEDK